MKKLLFLAAAVCTILVSCSKGGDPVNPTPEPEPKPEVQSKIPIKLSIGDYTKANDSAFETNDRVGIYVVNYNNTTPGTLANSGNHVNNMQFTYNGSAWNPQTAIYWEDKTTKADFYAYYPYGTPTDVSAYTFATKADQSSEANYWASDFLWGKATNVTPTESAVPITTNHVFSNILIYLKAGDGFTTETLAAAVEAVKVTNVKTSATINLSTGVATVSGNITEVKPWKVGEYYRAMIVPQTVAAGTNLITVTVGGVDYVMATAATFVANKQHKFTVTINKTSGGVNIGIGGWDSDGEEYEGSAE